MCTLSVCNFTYDYDSIDSKVLGNKVAVWLAPFWRTVQKSDLLYSCSLCQLWCRDEKWIIVCFRLYWRSLSLYRVCLWHLLPPSQESFDDNIATWLLVCVVCDYSVFLITLNQKRLSKLWDKYADNKKQKSSLSDFRVELVSPDSGERKKERLSLNFDLLSFLPLLFPTTTFLEHSFLPLH